MKWLTKQLEKRTVTFTWEIFGPTTKREEYMLTKEMNEWNFAFVWSVQQIFVLSILIKQSNKLLSMKTTKLSIERSTNSDRESKIYDKALITIWVETF
jgi:hypothetical protein